MRSDSLRSAHRFRATHALLVILAALFFGSASGQANAQPSLPLVTPAQWQQATETDLRAAHELLTENHPSAVVALGDIAFRRALEDGYRDAKIAAQHVVNYDGYQAVLAQFANGFGDRHIWSRPMYIPARLDWAGILIARRGAKWLVGDEDAADPANPLRGWQLVSCDGRSTDDLGRGTLGRYMIDWSVVAQQVQAAPVRRFARYWPSGRTESRRQPQAC